MDVTPKVSLGMAARVLYLLATHHSHSARFKNGEFDDAIMFCEASPHTSRDVVGSIACYGSLVEPFLVHMPDVRPIVRLVSCHVCRIV